MHAPEEYSAPYTQLGVARANFLGMIANIDDNVGQLRSFLREEGLEENTIFIFTTDNGTASGETIFNAQMRGKKGSEYDGGHRVPFFVHWPVGGLTGGRDVDPITAHVDVLPTLIELCGIQPPGKVVFDGESIRRLLGHGEQPGWPDRILVTDSQRVKDPIKWRKSAVMTSRWRLINGVELYDMDEDSGQSMDVAGGHAAVVERLRDFYERWWSELEPTFAQATAIHLGNPADDPACLTSHDWITTRSTPWNQAHVRQALRGAGNTGFWHVHVSHAGRYRFRLRRWPEEAHAAIDSSLPAGAPVPGVVAFRARPGVAFVPKKANLRIADQVISRDVDPGALETTFEVDLNAGRTKLWAEFETGEGEIYGAYYVYVSRLEGLD
jgi:arylsulfatase B